jgi:hypothetical protein
MVKDRTKEQVGDINACSTTSTVHQSYLMKKSSGTLGETGQTEDVD